MSGVFISTNQVFISAGPSGTRSNVTLRAASFSVGFSEAHETESKNKGIIMRELRLKGMDLPRGGICARRVVFCCFYANWNGMLKLFARTDEDSFVTLNFSLADLGTV